MNTNAYDAVSVVIPLWRRKILAYIANRNYYIAIPRGCGRSLVYTEWMNYLIEKSKQ